MNFPQSRTLGKSTYISGNPLSFSTIPNLRRKQYNFNMPTFTQDGKVRAAVNTNHRQEIPTNDSYLKHNNDIVNTVIVNETNKIKTDEPKLRIRTHQDENRNNLNIDVENKDNKGDSLNFENLGEKYIFQNKEKSIELGKSNFKMKNSGTVLKSSVIKSNMSSTLKKSGLPTVGNKCVLTNTSVIQIGTKFDSKNVGDENIKESINTGIAGKKNESRIFS